MWLQDSLTNHVWSDWKANARDVRILDARNRLSTVFNLSTYDLSVRTNFTTLKTLFLQAARASDTDHDGLLDAWEEVHWGSLTASPDEDPDEDGHDNAAEFAFGSDPTRADSRPEPLGVALHPGIPPVLDLTFRGRAGSLLDYSVEGAAELGIWTGEPPRTLSSVTVANQFDGTGTAQRTLRLTPLSTDTAHEFLRLRALSRP